jgi:hypothetical protein
MALRRHSVSPARHAINGTICCLYAHHVVINGTISCLYSHHVINGTISYLILITTCYTKLSFPFFVLWYDTAPKNKTKLPTSARSFCPQTHPKPTRRAEGNCYKLPQPGGPEGRQGPDYLAYVFASLGCIVICRLYKLTLSDQYQVTLQLRVFSDLV